MSDELEQIPSRIFRYDSQPVFVTWPRESDNWYVWGPEDNVKIGNVARVYKYTEDRLVSVEVLEYVAERMVFRKDNTKVRFVLASFDKVMGED
jgi:hypothetical protein